MVSIIKNWCKNHLIVSHALCINYAYYGQICVFLAKEMKSPENEVIETKFLLFT